MDDGPWTMDMNDRRMIWDMKNIMRYYLYNDLYKQGVTAVALLAVCLFAASNVAAQGNNSVVHKRGALWEVIWNSGFIGSAGAWDYLATEPLGMYPGFDNFFHPVGSEQNAYPGVWSNANFHNFRSGPWIVARDLLTPGQPPNFDPMPTNYEFYAVAQGPIRGIEAELPPIELQTNYIDSAGFNPLLPEEWSEATWHTNTGITVTRRSYVWSYPGYENFIIYDYTFKNTGQIVSLLTGTVVPNTEEFQQTLEDVYFAFHSGVSVSTKSQINFHDELVAIQAGAFGWQPGSYHDYYYLSDDRTLAFSYNYNGGAVPHPDDPFLLKETFQSAQSPEQLLEAGRYGSELMSPAAFGWLALYASPTGSGERSSPAPDVLRIDSFKDDGATFQGNELDLEFFSTNNTPASDYYAFATTPTLQPEVGNDGDRFNFYTFSYGPYTLAPGDSVRFVRAEIAGVMDYNEVIAGDPDGHFPDSTIAAIRHNAELARQAVSWGLGAEVGGIPLAADAPEPPPAPRTVAVNAPQGTENAAIGVTWTEIAETATITDGSEGVFYNGMQDLDGYRVYRSQDFQYDSGTQSTVLRGAAWTLLADIPASEFSNYYDEELGRYQYVDEDVDFGFRYGYYVQAYNSDPGSWTSANGTVVNNLPELASGSHKRSAPAAAVAGPVSSLDVYVTPNPYVFNDDVRSFGMNSPYRIEFRNLPERADIRIYTVAGDLVRTIEHGPDAFGNLSGTAVWDQQSDSGLLVAPGLYIYHVTPDAEGVTGEVVGKLMIIR